MAILKRLNPSANEKNALIVLEDNGFCCDSGLEKNDYFVFIPEPEAPNDQIGRIGIDGQTFLLSQNYPIIEGNAQAIQDEINAILANLGYIGGVTVTIDSNGLLFTAMQSEAVFSFIGNYIPINQASQQFKVFIEDFLELVTAPVDNDPTIALTIESFSIGGLVKTDVQGQTQNFIGGASSFANVVTWLNSLLIAHGFTFAYYGGADFLWALDFNRGIDPSTGQTDKFFTLGIRRVDAAPTNELYEISMDNTGSVSGSNVNIYINPQNQFIPTV
jgi:hypothetical protein